MTGPGEYKTFCFWEEKKISDREFPSSVLEESLEAVSKELWGKGLGTAGLHRFVNSQETVMDFFHQLNAPWMTAGLPFPPGTLGGLSRCIECLLVLILEHHSLLAEKWTERLCSVASLGECCLGIWHMCGPYYQRMFCLSILRIIATWDTSAAGT